MRPADVIAIKRDGGIWTYEQIEEFVSGYLRGAIADYQMSAWLMAVCWRGMSDRETADLTRVMAASGDLIDLSHLGNESADKHSSGGVGDKTSLIVGPIAAACGVKVAKMSGRGLAHTGGTIDKLESIEGFRTELTLSEFFSQVEQVGLVIAGQTANLAPADKKMYALRDVTGTVPSIPLIASSIMSKKIASGAKNIVLDVKTGKGAFMRTPEEAIVLAQTMVRIGQQLNRNVVTLITDMNQPLGHAVGNALEVAEAAAVLRGQGPSDLLAVSVQLASEMVRLAFALSGQEAEARVRAAVDSGAAYSKFYEWIVAQGGLWPGGIGCDLKLPLAPEQLVVASETEGTIASVDALTIGQAAMELGAGRVSLGASIDHRVGVLVYKRRGDSVRKGETLAILHVGDRTTAQEAVSLVRSAYTYTDCPVTPLPLCYAKVDEEGNLTSGQP